MAILKRRESEKGSVGNLKANEGNLFQMQTQEHFLQSSFGKYERLFLAL